MLESSRLYSGMQFPRNADSKRPVRQTLLSLLLSTLIGGGFWSCSGRADEVAEAVVVGILVAPGYAIVAPWALAGLAIDHVQEENVRRQLELGRAYPERIPNEVARSVTDIGEITADTVDELLDATGLTAYRNDVLILYLGTVEQDLWVYYRPDAALHARYDPITRRIIGPITCYSGRREQNAEGNPGP